MSCRAHSKEKGDDFVMCVGVVNGTSVALLDAKGRPRTFSCKGSAAGKRLCFSTHGHDAAEEFMTPCFDEEGNHGEPEEDCFCGIDTPHIHAHFYDPKICVEAEKNRAIKKKSGNDDFTYLARQTLHPTDHNLDYDDEAIPLINMEVSECLPNECNSKELGHHLNRHGDAKLRWSQNHRILKVKHDDHEDFLVHNKDTGDLLLEHPCGGCGGSDVHGTFKCVAKRRVYGGTKDIRLHFFEVTERPFSIFEVFDGMFDPTSERVRAALPKCCVQGDCRGGSAFQAAPCCEEGYCTAKPKANPEPEPCCKGGACHSSAIPCSDHGAPPPGTICSSFICDHICCSSEIPALESALEPLAGVKNIVIDVATKSVTVDHNPALITAHDILDALNRDHFGASIKPDSVATQKAKPDRVGKGVGRTQLFVQKICCASEIPTIRSIVEPLAGVTNILVNVPARMVYIDHDTLASSAQDICDALNADGFGANIKRDAAMNLGGAASAFVQSSLSFSDLTKTQTAALKKALGEFNPTQLESFEFNSSSGRILILHNSLVLSIAEISSALEEKTGIKTTVVVDGSSTVRWDNPIMKENEGPAVEDVKTRPKPTVILSGIFWGISLFSYIGGDWGYLKYSAALSVLFGLPSIGLKAFRTLKLYQVDTNVLMFSAAAGAVVLQEYTDAAAVTFLFAISEWLEVRATARARNALSAIVRLRPEKANVIHPSTKEIVVVPAASVPIGALVSVKTGDKIPCDGVVVGGSSTVDESSLTGESRPVRKDPKDEVSGGTVNSGYAELLVRTTATAENSAVSRLIRLVEEAQTNRSPTEKLVDEFAKRYTPLVILAALSLCTIPWAFGPEVGKEWTKTALVLLVVACPCALIISTPVTYVAGLAATAQNGVLIKGGAHLEALGMVRRVAFDKTGTLTRGNFALLHLETFGRRSRREVLELLALIEERASHPLAQAILAAAQNEGVTIPRTKYMSDHIHLAGEGISAVVDGATIHVGNHRLFYRLGLLDALPSDAGKVVESWVASGGTIGYMSVEGDGIVCAFCVADSIRPESLEVIRELGRLGVEATMLTGDNNAAALAIGRQAGLFDSQILSQLFPEEKLRIVEEMKDETRTDSSVLSNPCKRRNLVLMCGDGVNDAPALATADVGVAMGAGAALAMETSDVTLLDSDLGKLVYSLRMGRRVVRKILENVLFSLAVKAVVVGFTLNGQCHLWAAIASDVGAMLLVTLNGMTLLPYRDNGIQVDSESEQHPTETKMINSAASGYNTFGRADLGGFKKLFTRAKPTLPLWGNAANDYELVSKSEPLQAKKQ